MTADELRAWRTSHALSRQQLAELLGLSASIIDEYERGYRRGNAAQPRPIPRVVVLALERLGGETVRL
jgi:transcriptional regulator with XRE-family HTH domain